MKMAVFSLFKRGKHSETLTFNRLLAVNRISNFLSFQLDYASAGKKHDCSCALWIGRNNSTLYVGIARCKPSWHIIADVLIQQLSFV